jgi:N-acylglucosamine 2-epimerase
MIDQLLNDTLPFWTRHCIDREHGGFMMSLDREGRVTDTDKGMWQQCRFTWLLGKLYNTLEPRDEWLELARHGIDFIEAHGFDPADGRMWFHVTRDGRPIRKRRYAFSESFAAIAFAQFARATGSDTYAARARAACAAFRDHVPAPKFTATRPCKGLGHPMILLITLQELREAIGLEVDAEIDHIIDEIRRDFLKPELQCLMETVGPNGEIIDHADGRLLNPGHAIECAWFIMQEARHRNDKELLALGLDILRWSYARGWDPEFGGLLYFVDLYGHPVQEYWHDMKFWWPHNELIIASLLASVLTGDAEFAAMYERAHDWAHRHFPDHEHGEWYGYLRRDGAVSSTAKGNLWKGPFHMPRMQLFCGQLLKEHA